MSTALPNNLHHAPTLLHEVLELRNQVRSEGVRTFERWSGGIERRAFCAGALNLACYLALRRRDLRDIQLALTTWGLSSLGRSEGRVLPSLDALVANLERIVAPTYQPATQHPPLRHFLRGERALRENTAAIFGAPQRARDVRIMVTLPSEAARDPLLVRDLVARGMDCARINCAHDHPEAWARMIAHVRAAEAETGHHCKIHMDLAGPKARTGQVIASGKLKIGDRVLLTRTPPTPHPDHDFQTECMLTEALDQVQIGHRVWIDDGQISTAVESITPEGVLLRVLHTEPDGQKLRAEKGVNFPDTDLQLDPLTADDLATLDFVAHNADLIGYSFVQSAEDVAHLQAELTRRLGKAAARHLALVAKIETKRAVNNMPEIIVQGASHQPLAIMIARGDLAVEIGFERLAEIQEELLWLCEAAHVPVIWATQVLERYVKKGTPSRAEMTDAAMAARAECVMLNKGAYIAQGVTLLDDVLTRMQGHQFKKTPRLRALRSWADL
jgi:pyruvate kinase